VHDVEGDHGEWREGIDLRVSEVSEVSEDMLYQWLMGISGFYIGSNAGSCEQAAALS
jgi:hypothetical protein